MRGAQYSCLENLMDRGAWGATVHRITESDTTGHTCTQRFKDGNAALTWDQVDAKPNMVSTFLKCFLTMVLPSICATLLSHCWLPSFVLGPGGSTRSSSTPSFNLIRCSWRETDLLSSAPSPNQRKEIHLAQVRSGPNHLWPRERLISG